MPSVEWTRAGVARIKFDCEYHSHHVGLSRASLVALYGELQRALSEDEPEPGEVVPFRSESEG